LLPFFPNVTRLRIEGYSDRDDDKHDIPVFPKIRELEVTCFSLEGFSWIKKLFPSVETVYVTSKEKINVAKGKEYGIMVYYRNKSLEREFAAPNGSHLLFAMEHRCSPLVGAASDTQCSKEKFEQILKRSSPAYEAELNKRRAEFHFPALIYSMATTPLDSLSEALTRVEVIKPLLSRGFISYWTAFNSAVDLNSTDLALELLTGASEHIEEDIPFSDILSLISTLDSPKTFLDVVGEETTKKIFAATDKKGNNIIGAWVMDDYGMIDWSIFDEYIDWTKKVHHSNTKEVLDVATAAFKHGYFKKWKYLVVDKGMKVDIEEYPVELFSVLLREDNISEISVFAKIPEVAQKFLFLAAHTLRCGSELSTLEEIITIFGSEKLRECCNDEYILHYLIADSIYLADLRDIIPYLVKKYNLDINYIDKSGKTPLISFLEVAERQIEILEVILNLGADPNLAGTNTMPPLFCAIKSLSSDSLILAIEILLDFGANLHAVDFDKNGRKATPLSIAVAQGFEPQLIQHLISLGADPTFVDDAGNTLLHTLLLAEDLTSIIALIPLLSRYVDINRRNFLNETPLHRALLSGYDITLVQNLLDCGADVNLCGGLTLEPPLLMALPYFQTLKILLQHDKIDVKTKNRFGDSVVSELCVLTEFSPVVVNEFAALVEGKLNEKFSRYLFTFYLVISISLVSGWSTPPPKKNV